MAFANHDIGEINGTISRISGRFQGDGPGPFCGMMLADMGAEIIRVDRLELWAAVRVVLTFWHGVVRVSR